MYCRNIKEQVVGVKKGVGFGWYREIIGLTLEIDLYLRQKGQ